MNGTATAAKGLKRRPLPMTLSALAALLGLACACVMLCGLCLSACSSPSKLPVRDSLDNYTWDELSAISNEIAAASDDRAALEVAKRYHLANDAGQVDGSQHKQVELADGTKTSVLVAGFRHDDKAGGGKAGITFVFADAIAQRAMNNNAGFDELSESDAFDAVGGWNASEMRAWLNGDFADLLPADLRAVLLDVAKTSIAIPESQVAIVDDNDMASFSDESLVTAGVDKLWLPAVAEVGDPAEDAVAADEQSEWTSVLKAEGKRYQLFADAEQAGTLADARIRALASDGASDGKGSGSACRWWLRSVEYASFCNIRENGSLDRMGDELAAHPLGVVPCFAV